MNSNSNGYIFIGLEKENTYYRPSNELKLTKNIKENVVKVIEHWVKSIYVSIEEVKERCLKDNIKVELIPVMQEGLVEYKSKA